MYHVAISIAHHVQFYLNTKTSKLPIGGGRFMVFTDMVKIAKQDQVFFSQVKSKKRKTRYLLCIKRCVDLILFLIVS